MADGRNQGTRGESGRQGSAPSSRTSEWDLRPDAPEPKRKSTAKKDKPSTGLLETEFKRPPRPVQPPESVRRSTAPDAGRGKTERSEGYYDGGRPERSGEYASRSETNGSALRSDPNIGYSSSRSKPYLVYNSGRGVPRLGRETSDEYSPAGAMRGRNERRRPVEEREFEELEEEQQEREAAKERKGFGAWFKKKPELKDEPLRSEREELTETELYLLNRKPLLFDGRDRTELRKSYPGQIESLDEKERRQSRKKRAIIASITAVLVLGICSFLCLRFMRVQNVKFESLVNVDAEYAETLSGIRLGQHIFTLDESALETALNCDPRLEFQSVEYVFPDTLIIHINECLPAAEFSTTGGRVVTDMNGKVLSITGPEGSAGLVTGMNLVSFELGKVAVMDSENKETALKELLKVFDYFGLNSEIGEIDLTSTYMIGYRCKTGIYVELGTQEKLREKVDRAIRTINALKNEGIETGTVDVSYSDKAVYMLPDGSFSEEIDNALNYSLNQSEGNNSAEPEGGQTEPDAGTAEPVGGQTEPEAGMTEPGVG